MRNGAGPGKASHTAPPPGLLSLSGRCFHGKVITAGSQCWLAGDRLGAVAWGGRGWPGGGAAQGGGDGGASGGGVGGGGGGGLPVGPGGWGGGEARPCARRRGARAAA